jgi:hypothetical protein
VPFSLNKDFKGIHNLMGSSSGRLGYGDRGGKNQGHSSIFRGHSAGLSVMVYQSVISVMCATDQGIVSVAIMPFCQFNKLLLQLLVDEERIVLVSLREAPMSTFSNSAVGGQRLPHTLQNLITLIASNAPSLTEPYYLIGGRIPLRLNLQAHDYQNPVTEYFSNCLRPIPVLTCRVTSCFHLDYCLQFNKVIRFVGNQIIWLRR